MIQHIYVYIKLRRKNMIYPKFLNKGDTIDVPSPSAGIMDELEKRDIKWKR